MIQIRTLDQYMMSLEAMNKISSRQLPLDYYVEVAGPWFNYVAPEKAYEYGIECWLRLGVKALVVDTNACFYRWKQLRTLGSTKGQPSMKNVLLDSFGYATMIACLSKAPDYHIGTHNEEPDRMNDLLILNVWEAGVTEYASSWSLSMAFNMWRIVSEVR